MMKGKYLITTDNWFYAPDGRQYKAVWGDVEMLNDKDSLGISTNARSSNWYAKVGSEEHHIIIAGCQIHYSVRCDRAPNTQEVEDYLIENNECKRYIRPTAIYLAQQIED